MPRLRWWIECALLSRNNSLYKPHCYLCILDYANGRGTGCSRSPTLSCRISISGFFQWIFNELVTVTSHVEFITTLKPEGSGLNFTNILKRIFMNLNDDLIYKSALVREMPLIGKLLPEFIFLSKHGNILNHKEESNIPPSGLLSRLPSPLLRFLFGLLYIIQSLKYWIRGGLWPEVDNTSRCLDY